MSSNVSSGIMVENIDKMLNNMEAATPHESNLQDTQATFKSRATQLKQRQYHQNAKLYCAPVIPFTICAVAVLGLLATALWISGGVINAQNNGTTTGRDLLISGGVITGACVCCCLVAVIGVKTFNSKE